MKNTLSLWLAAVVFGLGMFSLSSPAEAHRHCLSCHHVQCVTCYHVPYRCETEPAYQVWTYQYPARDVCWVKIHGTWVKSSYQWVSCHR